MRKPLAPALTAHQRKLDVKEKRGDNLGTRSSLDMDRLLKPSRVNKKIFEVVITKCSGLMREGSNMNPRLMKPFFSFLFYVFDYRSPIESGPNPTYDLRVKYEIENSQELRQYLKSQFLKIDFADDSVDILGQPNVSDYIGSARLKLEQLLNADEIVDHECPVRNEKGVQTGKIDIKIRFYDTPQGYNEPMGASSAKAGSDGPSALNSEIIEKQVVIEITKAMVNQGVPDFDSILDMMFMYGKKDDNSLTIPKGALKSFIMDQLKLQISERDIDLFLRANPVLARRKDIIDRVDLNEIFEEPFKVLKKQKEQDRAFMKTPLTPGLGGLPPKSNQSAHLAEGDSRTTIGGQQNLPGRGVPSEAGVTATTIPMNRSGVQHQGQPQRV